tara:strand:- start:3600 stop:3938 length:339 start_codon:yes stop_codon:yes gene_type:complete
MSKHSFKYEHLKAQLKSDEELLRLDLNKVSQKFEKKWHSRLLGISLATAIIGLGYYWFNPKKKSSKKVKNKENSSYRKYSLRGAVYAFVLNLMPTIFEKIYRKIEGIKKTKN